MLSTMDFELLQRKIVNDFTVGELLQVAIVEKNEAQIVDARNMTISKIFTYIDLKYQFIINDIC